MIRAALVALILVLPAASQSTVDDRLYRSSVYAGIAAQGLDAASSWGGYEANPFLGRGHRFGWRSVAIKGGIACGSMLFQRYVLRRHPQHKRTLAIANYAVAGATTGIAVRNWRAR